MTELNQSEERIRQAQKMEAIGQLAGGLAHDLNNILGVIVLQAEAILSKPEDQSHVKEAARDILHAQDRAASLVRQLLAFGRKQASSPRRSNLNEIVSGMKRMLMIALGEEHELELRVEAELPEVHVDPVQVEQVLVNLVAFSKGTLPENGKILIQTGRDGTSDEAFVHLWVSDNGPGMDAATRLRLFEPYFAAYLHRQRSGLGLSTVYGIIHQQGGEITVESVLGKGTRFDVRLPTYRAEERAIRSGVGVRILLVDDQEQLREAIAASLRREGYHVTTASNGEAALALGKEVLESFALLVTDLAMPRLGGKTLAKRLREMNPGVRVLFISGYSDGSASEPVEQVDAIQFLAKPFTSGELMDRISELLASEEDK